MYREGIWEIGDTYITGHFEQGPWTIRSNSISGFYEQYMPNPQGVRSIGVYMNSSTFSQPYFMFSYQQFTDSSFCRALKDFALRNSLPYMGVQEPVENSQGAGQIQCAPVQKPKQKASGRKSRSFWIVWALLLALSLLMVFSEFTFYRIILLAIPVVLPLLFRKRLFVRAVPSLFLWLAAFTMFLAFVGLTDNSDISLDTSGIDKKIMVEQKGEGLSVSLPNWVLPEGRNISVKKDENPPAVPNNPEVLFQAYDIELPQDSIMEGVVEITLPYDKSLLPKGVEPEDALGAAYYDTKSRNWVTMPCIIDTHNNMVKIFTDHFSKYAVVIFKDGRKKLNERLPDFDCIPTDFYSLSELEQIVAEGSSGGLESTVAIEKGWNKFNELYNLTGAGSGVLQAVAGTKTWENVNKLMNEFGLGFALTQLAYDIYRGDNNAAVMNFTKNSAFYSVSKWGGDALGLASSGVTFMDLAINKFAETALDKNLQKWEDGYRKYYNTEPNAKRSAVDWYKTIARLHKESGSGVDFKAKLEAEVTAYCNIFWKDAEAYAYVAESTPGIRGFGAGGEYAKGVDEINNNFKAYLYETTIKPALAVYVKKQWLITYIKAEAEFNKLKAEMNKVYTVNVKLANFNAVKNKNAVTVRFINQKGEVVHSQGLDSSGQAILKMSLYGFIKAGGPLKAIVSVPAQENTAELKKEIAFTLDKTVVNINVPYTPGKAPAVQKKADKPATRKSESTKKQTVKPEEPKQETQPAQPKQIEYEYDYKAALAAWAADFAAEVNSRVYDDGVCKSTSEFEWVLQPFIRDGQVLGASRIWQTNNFYAGEHAGKTNRQTVNEAYDTNNPGPYISVGELESKYPQFKRQK